MQLLRSRLRGVEMAAGSSVLLLLSSAWVLFTFVAGQSLSLSACTDGFINQTLSTALQSGSLTIPYEQQRIIPGISFNCSGAITSWTIGAEWRTGGSHDFFPHLQIWRSTSCATNTYLLVGDAELFVAGGTERARDDYVFSGTPDPPLEFEAGDILGIFQPRESRSRVRVYYDTSAGPTNYYIDTGNADQPSVASFITTSADGTEDRLPLVTIEIGPSTSTSEPTEYDLFDEADLTTALQLDSLTIPYEQQRIIPDIPLNCSGAITSWTVGAEWRTGGNHNFFPHLQIWRSVVDGCSYALIGDTELFVSGGAERTRDDYIFTGTPDPAVEFQIGDILGIYQPRESRARVRVYYDTSTGPSNYYNDIGNADEPPLVVNQEDFGIITADGKENGLPLLAIQITIDCDLLENPENGTVVITAIATDSLTATYGCNTGFELVGEEVRDCNCQNTGGMWTGMAPACMLIDCGGLPVPVDSQVTYTPGVVASIDTGLNAVATYTCSEGYSLGGDAMRTCQANSQWNGAEPTCELIDCGDLTDPEDGQVTFTPGVVATIDTGLNAVATYACSEGYSLVGDAMRTCQADSQWNGAEPTCELIDCGGLADPEGGQITFTPGVVGTIDTGFNATAAYSCRVGYDLFGGAIRTCQSDDQWDGTEPICTPRSGECILGSTEVTETNFLDDGGQYLNFGNPAVCNGNLIAWHFCYYAADIAESDTYVVFLRVWRMVDVNSFQRIDDNPLNMAIDPPSNGQTLICEDLTLSTPLDIQRNDILGVYVPTTSLLGGPPLHIVARDTTNFGIFADTRTFLTPLISTTISTSDLENRTTLGLHLYADIVINCGNLTDPDDGQVAFTPGVVATIDTGFGAIATYTCIEGYSLVGNSVRTCQEIGVWDGAEPTCMLIDCGNLTDPDRGQVTFTPGVVVTVETGLGADANYTCNEGYDLVGDALRTCEENGQWNGGEPSCMLIDCGNLTAPEGGQIMLTPGVVVTADSGLNAVAAYSCNEGYSLDGDQMRTCQRNGEWTGAAPTCIFIDCGGLPDPEGGQVTFTPGVVTTIDTGLDAIAAYTCNSSAGYMLFDTGLSPTRTCQGSGQWSGVPALCTRCDFSTLTDPENGRFGIATAGGDITASYTCNMGYQLVGDEFLTCQSTGQFSGQEPLCVVIDCGNLTAPEDGKVTFTPGVVITLETGLDAIAIYTCNDGYNLVGDEMRACQTSEQWAGTEPNCTLIDCGNLTAPEDGQVTFTPGVVMTLETGLDAVATYTCSEGYELVGGTMRACQANEQWAGTEPNCTPIDCGNLTNPEGGQVTFTPGVVMTLETGLGAIANYTCNEGYDLVGDAMRTCQANQQWSGTEPNCAPIDCGNLTVPEDGQISFTPGVVITIETGLNAVATYTCNDGYNLVGDTMRTCQANQQWAGTEPNCMLIDCGNLTAPEDGQVTFTPGVVMILETGLDAVANYTCSDGYDLIGDEMRTCQVDGQWAGAEPTCMLINCTLLNDPENGQVIFTPGVVATIETGLGAVANYTCNGGYDLVGDTLRTCEANGQWAGAEPTCMLIDCGNLTNPEGGQVTFTPGVVMTLETGLDAVATYTCSEGYDLIGDTMRACQANEQWAGTEPNCTLIDCGNLTNPEGGQVTFTPGVVMIIETGLGAVATYTCSEGYDLVGADMRTCQANEQWAGTEPQCMTIDCGNLTVPEDGQILFTPGVVMTLETGLGAVANYTCSEGYDLVGDAMRACQANEQWTGTEPNCTLIDCGNLTAPEGGQVTFTPGVVTTLETGFGAIASYTCSEGYDLIGDEMRTCQVEGQWAGAEPTCMLINCTMLNDPENGQVIFTPGVVATIETGLGAVANYTCNGGYDLVGDTMRTCEANGQWAGAEPTCMLIDCGGLTNPEGGQVTFTPGLVATIETGLGAIANYTCNDGYDLVGDVLRTCQATEQWAGAEPTCMLIDCGNLTAPDDGQVTFAPGVVMTLETGLDAIATYTCSEGYGLVGDEMRTCLANELWTETEPTCVLIDCGNLTDPEGGQVTFTPGVVITLETGLDAIATYTCSEGYDLVGDAMRTCQANEQWAGTEPNCTLIDCGNLTAPEGGQVTFAPGVVMTLETGLDAIATYTCSEGYDLVGDAMRACQENQQWAGPEPNCSPIDCGQLIVPEGGQVTFTPGVVMTLETGLDAVATYTCSEGYDLVGDAMRTCLANGQWNRTDPSCTLIDCGGLINPGNGQVTITSGIVAETGVGALATYTCSEGYELMGNTVRTCQDTGDWNQVPPMCMLINCGNLDDPENGTVTINPGVVSVTGLNAVAIYTCNEGYNRIGDAMRTCQLNGEWDGAEPTCSFAPDTGSQTGSNTGLVAGIAAGVVIGVLVVSLAVVILVFLYRKRKKGVYKIPYGHPQNEHILANPLYQTPLEAAGNIQTLHGVRNILYETHGACDDNTLAIKRIGMQGLNALDLDGDYEDIGGQIDDYELAPMKPPAVDTGFVDNPVYGSASNGPATHYSMEASMEWGIRVPTQEHRHTLERSKPMEGDPYAIYSTLLECSEETEETQNTETSFFQEEDIYWSPASNKEDLYSQLAQHKYREILRNQMELGEKLGSGQFGTVDKGVWQSPAGPVEVAVKTLKEGASEQDRVKFLQEAAISGQFHHPNVIKLYGVVTVGEPALLIMELMSEGDLRTFFIQERPRLQEAARPAVATLCLEFCQQIASGMEYLSKKAFIHRDLAARNILLSKSRTCKIADFGMARDLEDENYYIAHGGQIPVKWTAPEALHFKKFSTASDVWSFGVLMYEIWSLGHKPFEGYSNQQAMIMIGQGHRLPPPPGCPKAIYKAMIKCWHPETSSRPTFADLQQALSDTDNLLSWSEEDTKAHLQAAVLGAPLDAGKDLYPKLQRTYL